MMMGEYMKKSIIIIIFTLLVVIIITLLLWYYPVKYGISLREFNLTQYGGNGKIALHCQGEQGTGSTWLVIDCNDITETPKYVDITGNTPDIILKKPLYNYLSNEFVFIGNFSADNAEIFIVNEWYIVGEINRGHLILPYPKTYLNIFEVKRCHPQKLNP